jgi:hypothetical protein
VNVPDDTDSSSSSDGNSSLSSFEVHEELYLDFEFDAQDEIDQLVQEALFDIAFDD